ncbi:MAG: isoprenylcysteine carboxylmethyltransferase family protein [Mesorhizobium sp.]
MSEATPPSRFPWPPLIVIAALAAAVLLGRFVPLPWIPAPLSDMLLAIGCVAIAAALLMDVMAWRTLRRHKTTVLPHRASTHLVTDGPFAITRNPIYVGYVTILIGLGLILGNVWFLATALAAGFALQKLAIEREERHLDTHFAKRWRDYSKRVRRWL